MALCPSRARGRRPELPIAEVPRLLPLELDGPRTHRPKWVVLSPTADPFTPNAAYDLGPVALEVMGQLLARGIGVTVMTRGGLPHADGLVTMARRYPGLVRVEIGMFSSDPALRQVWERGVAEPSARMGLLGAAAAAGADVGLRVGPIVPLVNDGERDLRKLVRAAAARGARTVAPMWVEDAPGLVAQVSREVSRGKARALDGWLAAGGRAGGGRRRLSEPVRRARLERLLGVARPLGIHVPVCACSVPEGHERCVVGPRSLPERNQIELFQTA